MITRQSFLIARLVSIVLALALAGLLGCDNQSQSAQREPTHADQAMTPPELMSPAMHSEHDDAPAESMLMVMTSPAAVNPGQPINLNLMIHNATGAMIKDFETVHEKKVHLIIVRDGLDQFAHIHPEVDPAGNISGTFTFPTAGTYNLFADYKLAGQAPAAAMGKVIVAGSPPPKLDLIANVPGRVKTDGLTADIAIENATPGATTRISFKLFDTSGQPVIDLQPYLGAMGHLVVLSADGQRYIHSHPLDAKSPDDAVAFASHFPRPGIYKGWGQFQRSGTVFTVPFVVTIK